MKVDKEGRGEGGKGGPGRVYPERRGGIEVRGIEVSKGNNIPYSLIDTKMSRCWTWTLNNPTSQVAWKPAIMTYLVYVEQKAPTTGTRHFQGYVQFKKKKAIQHFRTAIPGAHGEKSKGDAASNIRYIKEDEKKTNIGGVVEHGEPDPAAWVAPAQGKRNDLVAAMESAAEGKSKLEMMEAHPTVMARYGKFISEYKELKEAPKLSDIAWPVRTPWCVIEKPAPNNKQRHWYIWGPPNLGKTYAMQSILGATKTYWVPNKDKYRYEGYDNEELIVYDDCNNIPVSELIEISNTWLSAKEVPGESRYTRKYWRRGQTRTIVILSNHAPQYSSDNWAAFDARFNVVYATVAYAPAGTVREPLSPRSAARVVIHVE